VIGPNIVRSQHRPFCIVPRFGQLSEYGIHPPHKQAWDVFQEDVSGSSQANESDDFKEQPAPLSVDPFPLAGD
tara:strand:+ start:454 stop:672 length:219 start_codon:yes stop_codon:yes gene_type:complete